MSSPRHTHPFVQSFAVVAAVLVVTSTVAPVAATAALAPAGGVAAANTDFPAPLAASPAPVDAQAPIDPPDSLGSDVGAAAVAGTAAPASTAGTTGHEPWYFYFSGVNTANGNLYRAEEDLSIGALGGDLRIVRAYSSHASADHGPFGFGWTHNYNVRLDERPDGSVALLDADGSVHEFAPTAGGYAAPPGVHTRLEATAGGWVLRRTDGTGYRFDADGRLEALEDANGNHVRLTYAGDRLVRIADDAGQQLDLAYDAAGRITAVTDPLGRTVRYAYETGDLVAVTDPANRTTTYDYYENHKLRQAVEPSGRVRTIAYDPGTDRVRCVGSGRAASGCSEAGYAVTYDDDAGTTSFRNLLSDRVTTVELSDRGTPLRVETPTETVAFGWDAEFNRVSTTNRTGTYEYAYDDYGHRTEAVDAFGNVERWEWETTDDAGRYQSRLVSHTDARGATTSYGYDAAGNRVSVTNAAGDTRRLTYDANGSLVSRTDFGGHETRYAYDARGFRTAVVAPDGGVTNVTRDAVGRVTSRTDPLGNTYRYEYDAVDNLVRLVDPLGGETTARYDAQGTLQGVTRPDGQVRRPDGVPSPPFPRGADVDESGNVTTIETDEYTLTRRVDARGRLVERTVDYGPFAHTSEYRYDEAGALVSVLLPDGTRRIEHDALGRTTRVDGPDGTWATYAYDDAGRRIATNYSNGVGTSYEYDPAGRPTRIVVAAANGSTLTDRRYAYDAAGNPTSVTDADGDVTTYGYDALGRLVSVAFPDGETVTYGYDGAGDRVSRTVNGTGTTDYVYDDRGRLTRVGVTRYSYDANGSLVGKTVNVVDANGSRTDVTRLAYDAAGRLANVTTPAGETVTYDYLPNGERLSRTTADGTTYFLYAGFELAAEYRANGTVRAQYLQGPGVDDPVARITDGGTAFYHRDGARNVRLVTDAAGAAANRYSYTPFGRLRERTEAIDNPYRFGARRYDDVSGLYYNRLRYYDPATGRFTRIDPAGLSAGLNWYAYADNSPARYTDPMGLDRWEGRGISAGGTLLVGGFSSFTGTFENLDTGQTCTGTMYCAKAGIGLGGSVTKAVTHFDGPSCGESLRSTSIDFSVCAAGGAGIGAEGCANLGSDGGQAGAGVGGFWGAALEAVVLICSVRDLDCSCVEGCGECDDDDDPPPGNDHPDDNHDLSTLSYAERYPAAGAGFPDFEYGAGSVAVLSRGFSAELTDFLAERNVTAETVPATVDPDELARYDALVVPSGGLHGLQSFGSFESTLEGYVDGGGTLVVLSQPRGYHYDPVPGGLGGYGWLEDQSCQLGSVGVTTFCAPLSSLEDGVADLNVDGYFTAYPNDATVLLSRTKNGEPAMLTYDYGDGRVLATAAYPDWAFGHHASHADGRAILADVVSWARYGRTVTEYGPGERAAVNGTVTSYVDVAVDDVRVEFVDPDGQSYATNVSGGLAPLANRSVVAGATLPTRAARGLWTAEYSLANDTYGVVQRGRLDRFAVVAFDPTADGWSYRGGNLSLSVNSDSEQYADGANASFTLTVRNRGDAAETVTVYWSFPHNYWETREAIYGAGTTRPATRDSPLNRTLTVPAGGSESVGYEVPVVSYDRLWAEFHRGPNTSGEYLGRASRGFFTFEPAVDVDVATNVSAFVPGDDATVTASLSADDALDVERSIRVVGPDGGLVAASRTSVSLTPGATRNATLTADLPSPTRGGIYTVVAEATNGGETVGYDSTTFAVPVTDLSVAPDFPEPLANASTVGFDVEHVRGFATNATLNVSLVDPAGAVAWETSEPLAVAPNATGRVTVAPTLDARAVGDSRLRATLSWGAGRSIDRAWTLPNGATATTTFDRRTYAQGGTADATVTVTNLGAFDRDLPVAVAVPDAGFAETRTATLAPGENATLGFAVALPGDIAAGSHDATVTLGAGTAHERTRTDAIVVPESSLSVSVPRGTYPAGDPLPVAVANDGGVATTADCSLTLYGPTGRQFDAVAGTPTIAAGGTATPSLAAPAAAATGPYLVAGRCTDTRTGVETRLARSIAVDGLNASVTSTTDSLQYASGGDVGVATTIENRGDAIVDGTVTIRVRDPSVGAGTNGSTGTAGVDGAVDAAGADATDGTDGSSTDGDDAGTTDGVGTDGLANESTGDEPVGDEPTGNETTGPPAPVDDSRPPAHEVLAGDDGASDEDAVSTAAVSAAKLREAGGSLAGARTVGDTTVTTATTWSDETVLLEGNLTVGAGGDLTLSNVTLVVNSTFDGEYRLEVLSGGAIDLRANTTVIARDTGFPYAFQVRPNAAFAARDATVRDVGWSSYSGAGYDERGLYVAGTVATIDGLTVTDSPDGLVLFGTDDAVLSNVSASDLYVEAAENVTLTGYSWDGDVTASVTLDEVNNSSVVANNFTGIGYDDVRVSLVEASDNVVRDNAFDEELELIGFETYDDDPFGADRNLIEHNAFDGGSVSVSNSNDTVVANNTFAGYGSISVGGYRSVVRDNVLSIVAWRRSSIRAVGTAMGTGTRVVNNTASEYQVDAGGAELRDNRGHSAVVEGDDAVLAGNAFTGPSSGLVLRGDNTTVRNGNVSVNERYGLFLDRATNATIETVTAVDNADADFDVETTTFGTGDRGTPATFAHDVSNVTVTGGPLYYLTNRVDATVPTDAGMVWIAGGRNVTVANVTAPTVGLAYTENATVRDVAVSDGYYGVLAYFTNGSRIENATARGARYGVYLEGSRHNVVAGTDADGTGVRYAAGVRLREAHRNVVRGSLVTGGTDGIELIDAHNNTVEANDVSNGASVDGVYVDGSNDNLVTGNRLTSTIETWGGERNVLADNRIVDAQYGINLRYASSRNTTVRNNTVVAPTRTGISLDGAVDSLVVDNVVDGWSPARKTTTYRTGVGVTDRAADSRLVGNRLANVSLGVGVERRATDTVVRGGTITGAAYDGVRVESSSGGTTNTTVADLTIEAVGGAGVELAGAEAATLSNLTLVDVGEGLSVRPAERDAGPVYWRHDVTDVTVDGAPVYYWRNRTDASIPADAGAVWVVDSTNVTVGHGTSATLVASPDSVVADLAIDGPRYGVELRYANRTVVRNVTAANGTAGVYARDAANVTVRDVEARTGVNGIYVRDARDVTVRNATVTGNDRGVQLWAVDDSLVTGVEATRNGQGIALTSSNRNALTSLRAVDNDDAGVRMNGTYADGPSDGNELTGSRLAGGYRGVWLSAASDGLLANNTIVDNRRYGIVLAGNSYYTSIDTSADGNLIYNNYVDNPATDAVDAVDNSVGNRWNVSKRPGENVVGGPFLGGNYWGSYGGVDADGDGLGDTALPYNATDRYGEAQIEVGGDALPLVPESTAGEVVYETTVPVDVAAGATRRLNTTLPGAALGIEGKLTLETELTSSPNQTVATHDTAFYVVDGDTLLTLDTDRETYAPGESIAVSGTVFNRGGSSRTYDLSVDAGGVEVYADAVTVAAGASADYAFETPADAPTLLTATAGGVTVSQAVDVVAPSVNATLSAPEVVGRAPFDATVRIANDGTVPVTVNATVAGGPETRLTVAPNGTRAVTETTSLTSNGTVTATLSGDVSATLSRSVTMGERGTVTVSPPAVAPPGALEVPYVVENTGERDAAFDATIAVGDRTITRAVAVPAGGRTAGRVVANLTPGTYAVEATTPFGSDAATVRVAEPDRLALTATVANATNGTVRATVDVANVGSTDVNATLRAVTAGTGADGDVRAAATREVAVPAGTDRTVTLDVRVPAGTPPGQYDLRIAAIADGGGLAATTGRFAVRAPTFELATVPTAPSFDADELATLPFAVANVGSLPGEATLNVTVPGIAETTRTAADVTFVVPDDLPSGTYPVEYALDADSDGDGLGDGEPVRGETTLTVRGVNVSVDGGLDARLYDAGDDATLTVTATNERTVPVELFARVQYNGYDVRQPFALNGSESATLSFEVPITFPVGGDRKVFYGVYHADGRSLHIDGAYPHERRANLTLYTDRDSYDVGETVTVTVDPARTGEVALSAPNLTRRATFGDRRTFTFVVPPLRSGTRYVHASVENESVSYPFDVDGYHARVLEAALDRRSYTGGDDVTLDLAIDPNRNVTTDVTATVVDPDGLGVASASTTADLRVGGTDVSLTATLPTNASGVYTVVYTVAADVGGPVPLRLLEGSQYVDVAANPGATPTAAFEFDPTEPAVGQDVRFDGGDSTAARGEVASYAWDLDGDGTVDATGEVTRYAFASAGEHDVTLTVTDGEGRTNETTLTVSVRRSVSLDLVANRTTVPPNGTVRFALTRADTGDPVDGTLLIDGARLATGADGEAVYRFETAGGVLVTATAASTADTSFGLATLSIAVAVPFPDGVPGVRGGAPTDVDDDGRYEDVNGDGRLDFFDVIDLLFADWGAINADPAGRAAFDLDGSGGVGFLDVVHLLFDL